MGVSRSIRVLGDSVAAGYGTDDSPAWPHRIADAPGESVSVTVRGGVGTTLTDHAADTATAGDSGEVTVLVHAGHNDAFRAAAARLDAALSAADRVTSHAFVGLLPLLDVAGGVGFSAAQPQRALAFDDALAAAVDTHLPVARPIDAWRDRTRDGVHPTPTGHQAVASTVADWLAGEP